MDCDMPQLVEQQQQPDKQAPGGGDRHNSSSQYTCKERMQLRSTADLLLIQAGMLNDTD
jgi:hypothetical protein